MLERIFFFSTSESAVSPFHTSSVVFFLQAQEVSSSAALQQEFSVQPIGSSWPSRRG